MGVVAQCTGTHRKPLPALSEIVESNGKLFADGTLVAGAPVTNGLRILSVPLGTQRPELIDYVRESRLPEGANGYLLGEAIDAQRSDTYGFPKLEVFGISLEQNQKVMIYSIQFYKIERKN